jgi:hypothetical protein
MELTLIVQHGVGYLLTGVKVVVAVWKQLPLRTGLVSVWVLSSSWVCLLDLFTFRVSLSSIIRELLLHSQGCLVIFSESVSTLGEMGRRRMWLVLVRFDTYYPVWNG